MLSSDAGKTKLLVAEIVNKLLAAKGDTSDRPLIADYVAAIIDPHGKPSQDLLARIAKMPDGNQIIADMKVLRARLRIDPLRRRDEDDGESKSPQ